MRQTFVRQKLAEELPVPSDSKMMRLGMSSPNYRIESAGRDHPGSERIFFVINESAAALDWLPPL
jgi:hypothetical protein